MIDLPDFDRAFDYENDFYLSCAPSRLAKVLAHYELIKRTWELPGAIVECGVFKGCSLARFSIFRELLGRGGDGAMTHRKLIVAFDTFGEFPEASDEDREQRDRFVSEAGSQSISLEQLRSVLDHKGTGADVELVAGDLCQTLPAYVERHPDLEVSLINLDTDLYEPAVVILECLWPRLVSGGVLMLDDYDVFPGETRAVDEYFKGQDVEIERLPFAETPSFVVKR